MENAWHLIALLERLPSTACSIEPIACADEHFPGPAHAAAAQGGYRPQQSKQQEPLDGHAGAIAMAAVQSLARTVSCPADDGHCRFGLSTAMHHAPEACLCCRDVSLALQAEIARLCLGGPPPQMLVAAYTMRVLRGLSRSHTHHTHIPLAA